MTKAYASYVLALLVLLARSGSALSFADVRHATLKCEHHIGYEHASGPGTIVLKGGAQTLTDQTHLRIFETYSAFGDLDGQGEKDGAVVLFQFSPGTGTWGHLLLLEDHGGKPYCRTAISLGDRTQVHSMKIAARKVVVDLTAHRPHDPMCCPHRRQTLIVDPASPLRVQRSDNTTGTDLRYAAVTEDLEGRFGMTADGDDWHGSYENARLDVWGPAENVERVILTLQSNQMPLLKPFLQNTVPLCAVELEKWGLSVAAQTPDAEGLSQASRRCLNRQVILQTFRGASAPDIWISAIVMSVPAAVP